MSLSAEFSLEPLRSRLSERAGARWEIFAKRAVAREVRVSPKLREESDRLEEGYAARWEEGTSTLFASASSVPLLLAGIAEAGRLNAGSHDPLPSLPGGRFEDGTATPEIPGSTSSTRSPSSLLPSRRATRG